MDAQTYHDLHQTLTTLGDKIRSHQYSGDRHGVIPPAGMAEALKDLTDATATCSALLGVTPHLEAAS